MQNGPELDSPGRGRSRTIDGASNTSINNPRALPRGISPRKAGIIKKDGLSTSQTNLQSLVADSKMSLNQTPVQMAPAPLVIIDSQKSLTSEVPKLAVIPSDENGLPSAKKPEETPKASFLADIVQQSVVLGVAIPSMGTNRQMRFNNKSTVPEALETIRRALQPIVIPNFEQMTLFSLRGGIWLNGPHTLGDYSLRQKDRLKVIPKVPSLVSYSIRVFIPPSPSALPPDPTASTLVPELFKFWKETTVAGLVQLVNMRVRLSETELLRMGIFHTKKADFLPETLLLLDCNLTKPEDVLEFKEMPQTLLQEVEATRAQPIKSTREIFEALEHRSDQLSSSPITSSPLSPGTADKKEAKRREKEEREAREKAQKKEKKEEKERERKEREQKKKERDAVGVGSSPSLPILGGRRESRPTPVDPSASTSTLLGGAALGSTPITASNSDSSPRSNGGSFVGTPKRVRKGRDDGYESDSSSSAGNNAIITPLRESLAGSPNTNTASDGIKLNTAELPAAQPSSFSGRESRDRDRVFKKQISNFLEKISRAKASTSGEPLSSSGSDAPASPQQQTPGTPTSSSATATPVSVPPLGSGVLVKQPCVDLELLYRFVKYLEENALDYEGIFRISGNSNFIKDLCDKAEYLQLQQHTSSSYLAATLGSEYYSLPPADATDFKRPHTVAGAIIALLRDCTDAVIPDACYDLFMKATNVPVADQRLEALKAAVASLPIRNWAALYLLMRLVKKICDRSETNKMNAKNLGICFGMSIIRPPQDLSLANVGAVQAQCLTIEYMTTSFEAIFLEPKIVYTKISAALSQCPDDSSPSSWMEYRIYAGLLAELLQQNIAFSAYLKESVGLEGTFALLKHLSQPYLPTRRKQATA